VRGAKFGDVVAIDVIKLTPFGVGNSAILRDFGCCAASFRNRWRCRRRYAMAVTGSAAAFRCHSPTRMIR